jgi:hypothetical protein
MPCKNQGMSTPQSTTDLLDRLDAEDLRARLDRLESERAAILVLLRAARAKERAAQRRARTAPSGQEVGREG